MRRREMGWVLGAALVMTGCAGKVVVTRVPATGAAPMDGVYYALPKTVVKLEQPIERTARKPGRYAVYVPLFFPETSEAVEKASVVFKAGKPVVSTFGEPDPNEIFYLKLKGNGPVDRTGLLEYTEQGTVAGAAGQADNVTSDIVLSVVGTMAGIAAKSFGAGLVGPQKEECEKRHEEASIPCRIASFDARAINSEGLLMTYGGLEAGVRQKLDAAAAEGKTNFESALGAYAEIYELEATRNDVRKVALAPEAALKDLDAEIAGKMGAAFTGTQKKDSWTYSKDVRDFRLTDQVEILRMDVSKGVCVEGANAIPKEFRMSEGCGDKQRGKALSVSFALNPVNGQIFQRLGDVPQEGERGFYYRIPATANVTVKLGDETLLESKQTIAQFGIVASLPASTGGKSTAYTLKFYEATGALKSFAVNSKAVMQKSTADALGTDVSGIAEAKGSPWAKKH